MNTNFSNLFSLSKTLRFELIPEPGVREYIEKLKLSIVHKEKSTLMDADEHRKRMYDKYKLLIDECHKWYIDKKLNAFVNKNDEIEKVKELLNHHYMQFIQKVKFDKQNELIKLLCKHFADSNIFKSEAIIDVDNKKKKTKKSNDSAIKNHIQDWFVSEEYINTKRNIDEDKKTLTAFDGFFTYLGNYNNIRENLYKSDGKKGTIGNRIFYKNLDVFCKNIKLFNSLPEDLKEKINIDFDKDDLFTIDSYLHFITQKGIDNFNEIIGNKAVNTGEKQDKGVNGLINEYNQNQTKKNKIKKFKKLQNQILFRVKDSSYKRKINTNDDLVEVLNFYIKETDFINQIKTQFELLSSDSLYEIFISKRNLSNISKLIFTDLIDESHFAIKNGLRVVFENTMNKTIEKTNNKGQKIYKNKTTKQIEEEIIKFMKNDYFDLLAVENAVKYIAENENIETLKKFSIVDFFKQATIRITEETWNDAKKEKQRITVTKNLFDELKNNVVDVKNLLHDFDFEKPLYKQKNHKDRPIEIIKKYLDALQQLAQFALLCKVDEEKVENGELEVDIDFYNSLQNTTEACFGVIENYKQIAAYLTQKEYDSSKMLIRFDRQKNIGGWTESVTDNSKNYTQHGGYLFRKKRADNLYDYYLGVCKNPKLFKCIEKNKVSENDYSEFERLEYYFIDSKSFYNTQFTIDYAQFKKDFISFFVNFLKENKSKINENDYIKITNKIDKVKEDNKTPSLYFNLIYENNALNKQLLENKQFKDFNAKQINETIASMQNIKRLNFDAEFYEVGRYNYFTDIMNAVEKQLAKHRCFNYFPISKTELASINSPDNKGEINNPFLLFKIQNKDLKFLPNKKNKNATKNLHTLYFEELMRGGQATYDLGSAEVFFRKSSLHYGNSTWEKGHHFNDEKNLEAKFKQTQYDKYPQQIGEGEFATNGNARIIKDKRYGQDKYLLHLSISCNYQEPEKPNEKVLDALNINTIEFLKQNPDFKIIGIDRGERHLLYVSVIDCNGKIEFQKSLNILENKNFDKKIEYHTKLTQKENERIKARQNWSAIENISKLKEGYLSQAVHEITNLIKKYDYKAIVVLEDLNAGFIQERASIEKNIYQKFENKLIEKLGFWVDKSNSESLQNPKQMAVPLGVEKLKNVKHNGFILYVPAAYTSKIDPTTGFMFLPYIVNLSFESITKSQKIFEEKIKNFKWNEEEQYFQFDLNFKHKTKVDKKEIDVMDITYTICTLANARRYYYSSKNKSVRKIDVTQELKDVFNKYKIDYQNTHNVETEIAKMNDESFFKKLLFLLKSTLTLRHTDAEGNDNIISPVKNNYGRFFNSAETDEYNLQLPNNADANGAFHIALKGKFLLEKLFKLDKVSEKDYEYSLVNWFNDLEKYHSNTN